jgi:uncharacterized protein
VQEAGSARVRKLLDKGGVATSRLSEVEVASALARRCWEGDLTPEHRDRALAALRGDVAALYVIELLPEVTSAALELLVRHPLRAGDAVQLASCLRLRERADVDVRFVAFDSRLIEAARAEGATILSLS